MAGFKKERMEELVLHNNLKEVRTEQKLSS
ncbi:hypothetical protein B0P06_005678 [Clostridium saccharoperbutylacetonicum]|nr:hypothetical protein [Clostridium saccharoperbutylacetonicum]NSB26557.1 hypothetical protein [Clostridium saccharoperbutylacetonicum]NSB45907.1 hypothetical protein [Clostridium saccharoperbutylacetonicum]